MSRLPVTARGKTWHRMAAIQITKSRNHHDHSASLSLALNVSNCFVHQICDDLRHSAHLRHLLDLERHSRRGRSGRSGRGPLLATLATLRSLGRRLLSSDTEAWHMTAASTALRVPASSSSWRRAVISSNREATVTSSLPTSPK